MGISGSVQHVSTIRGYQLQRSKRPRTNVIYNDLIGGELANLETKTLSTSSAVVSIFGATAKAHQSDMANAAQLSASVLAKRIKALQGNHQSEEAPEKQPISDEFMRLTNLLYVTRRQCVDFKKKIRILNKRTHDLKSLL